MSGIWWTGDTERPGTPSWRVETWPRAGGVELAPGAVFPHAVEFEYAGQDEKTPSITAVVETRDGRPEVVSWTFTCPEGVRGLRRCDFQAVDVGLFLENTARALGIHYSPSDPEALPRAVRRSPRRRGGPPLTEVAAVYREGLDSGKPTQAVAERFGVAHRTAALYVQRAREAGELGASVPGRAGEADV